MLAINNLSVSYETPILDQISFSIKPGQIVSVVGKSGVGKTTLLNKIVNKDQRISRTDSLALMTQESLLLDWRTVLENVLLPKELAGNVAESDINNAKELLAKVRLESAVAKFPSELSGGMKQRAALARALLQGAELYLFDEPLSAIDFDLRIILGRIIREFIVKNSRAALFVTHNFEEAISVGDRVLVLGSSPGKIIAEYDVPFDDAERDPVKLRDNKSFTELFGELWRTQAV